MRHLCRDFLTLASASCPGTNMYALGMFLVHCGGFSMVGQTNFDLLGTGSLKVQGISGTINMGFGADEVFLPTGSYLVSAADIGRILALKSLQNPLANSGLFRITGIDLVNNCVIIDYRSAAAPPPEQYLVWRIFESENVVSLTWRSGSNGIVGGYGSYSPNTGSTASASRIILRSPDQSSWEVRMCLDSQVDIHGAVPSGFSIAPGYGGNGNGDFAPLSFGEGINKRLHLHAAAWYNTTGSQFQGMTVGLTPLLAPTGSSPWTHGQWRISMMVDDVSGTCGIVNENVNLPVTNTSGSGWCVFGLTEDETEFPGQSNLSNAVVNIARLFVIGSSNPQSNLTWESQFHADNNIQVVGWSKYGYPVAGVLSLYSDITNPQGPFRFLTSSADTPWTNSTELLDAEVLLGTVDVTQSASAGPVLWQPLQPRRLGRLPMFLQGRANYAKWTVTGDGGWYHTQDGVFMSWGGPVPTGNVVTSSAYPMLSSNELQQGLDMQGAFLPGSDPPVPVEPPNISDVDSTRFRKTYSYFRQVPVNVGTIKGGSNPAKP